VAQTMLEELRVQLSTGRNSVKVIFFTEYFVLGALDNKPCNYFHFDIIV
jgi:hypothetical protein